MALQPTKRRFTVADYYQMGESGILGEDERVELIDGEIIDMSPIGDRHAACVTDSQETLTHAVGQTAQVRVQNPIRLDAFTEPVPDIALVRRRPDSYRTGHPTAAEILLIVEVADTTLRYDRGVKVPLYARFGIPELWIVGLKQQTVTVYRDPTPDGYRSIQTVRSGERIAIPGLEGVEIAVADILG